MKKGKKIKKKSGKGLFNKAIDSLSRELHVPGYNFCGPGTKLDKRLKRGDKGVNLLDEACREHDISYNHHKNLDERHKADKILLNKAVDRLRSSDASFGEKAVALGVAGAMKLKTKFGMGLNKNNKNLKKKSKKKSVRKTRQLPLPKVGGFLPILAALGALGSLAGGAASIYKTVDAVSKNAKELKELQRHNRFIEGKGLFLSPYKKGQGLRKKSNRRKKK